MAQKFWERKDFDIALFTITFRYFYKAFYETCYNGKEFRERVAQGDKLLRDRSLTPLLVAFNDYRKDILTSDREVAAFAVTYGVYHQRFSCAA